MIHEQASIHGDTCKRNYLSKKAEVVVFPGLVLCCDTLFEVSQRNEHVELSTWVRRCRAGDERAWSALIQHFQAFVYSIPRRMGLSSDECADVFQATFVALYKNLDRVDSEQSIPKWLAVTASRESYRILRGRRSSQTADVSSETLEAVLADESESVGHQLEQAELSRTVQKGLGGIPERCRKLLQLLYSTDDVPYTEISEQLGLPVGSIGPTRARCLQKLREILEPLGFFNDMYQEHMDSTPKDRLP